MCKPYATVSTTDVGACFEEWFRCAPSQQGRQAVFDRQDLLNMLFEAGFEVTDKAFAYGKFGRWGHEFWSMTTMLMGSGRWPLVTLGVVVAPISLVLLLILKGLDQSSILTDGNGIYCECRKR